MYWVQGRAGTRSTAGIGAGTRGAGTRFTGSRGAETRSTGSRRGGEIRNCRSRGAVLLFCSHVLPLLFPYSVLL